MTDPRQKLVEALLKQGASEDEIGSILDEYDHQHRFADANLPARVKGSPEGIVAGPQYGGAGDEPRTPDATDQLTNVFQGMSRGATAGLSPVLAGLASKTGVVGERAGQATRATNEQFQREHPWASAATNIAGAAINPLFRSLPGVTLPGAAAGGVGGALARGAGNALTGQLYSIPAAGLDAGGSLEDRLRAAVAQSTNPTGALLGAAIPAALSLGGSTIKGVGRMLGMTSAAGRQTAADRAIEEGLSRTGQTGAQAVERAGALTTAGVPDVSVAEAMGPGSVSVLDRLKAGLSAQRDATGVSPSGNAAQFAQRLRSAIESANSPGKRTGPLTDQLYAEAKSSGGIDPVNVAPVKPDGSGIGVQVPDGSAAARALQYFMKEFPTAQKQVWDELDRQIKEGTLAPDQIIQNGKPTLHFWDTYKQFLDGHVQGKATSNNSWARTQKRRAQTELANLVQGLDEAVSYQTGHNLYGEARTQAGTDIQARKGLTEQQGPLASSLESISQRTGTAIDPNSAAANIGAHRTSIGISHALRDLLMAGARRSGQAENAVTLTDLLRSDPEAFFPEMAQRGEGRGKAATRRNLLGAALGGYVGGTDR